jgi:hypothetical protein
MSKQFISILSVLCLVILSFQACQENTESATIGSPENKKKTQFDVHENSEMAIFMRDMEARFKALRDSISQNEGYASINLDMGKIFTAEIFDPSKSGPQFDGFAHNFLSLVETLERAESEQEKKKIFNNAVEGCIACHKAYCPGPITAIKKLKINE